MQAVLHLRGGMVLAQYDLDRDCYGLDCKNVCSESYSNMVIYDSRGRTICKFDTDAGPLSKKVTNTTVTPKGQIVMFSEGGSHDIWDLTTLVVRSYPAGTSTRDVLDSDVPPPKIKRADIEAAPDPDDNQAARH